MRCLGVKNAGRCETLIFRFKQVEAFIARENIFDLYSYVCVDFYFELYNNDESESAMNLRMNTNVDPLVILIYFESVRNLMTPRKRIYDLIIDVTSGENLELIDAPVKKLPYWLRILITFIRSPRHWLKKQRVKKGHLIKMYT